MDKEKNFDFEFSKSRTSNKFSNYEKAASDLREKLKQAHKEKAARDAARQARSQRNLEIYIRNKLPSEAKIAKKLIDAAASLGDNSVRLFDVPRQSWWHGLDSVTIKDLDKVMDIVNMDMVAIRLNASYRNRETWRVNQWGMPIMEEILCVQVRPRNN